MKRMKAVATINHAIRNMDFYAIETTLLEQDEDSIGVEIPCSVSYQEWEYYVRSPEKQVLKSSLMEWHDGKLYIVELNTTRTMHCLSRIQQELDTAENAKSYAEKYLMWWSFCAEGVDADGDDLPLLQPSLCCIPIRPVDGAVIPRGMEPDDFHTVKVEIGQARSWTRLNQKAEQWRRFPGVQYVLCIKVSPDMKTRQYRLDSVVNGEFERPRSPVADIVDPTKVELDSRRLLGLLPDDVLPSESFGPTFFFDLFNALKRLV